MFVYQNRSENVKIVSKFSILFFSFENEIFLLKIIDFHQVSGPGSLQQYAQSAQNFQAAQLGYSSKKKHDNLSNYIIFLIFDAKIIDFEQTFSHQNR